VASIFNNLSLLFSQTTAGNFSEVGGTVAEIGGELFKFFGLINATMNIVNTIKKPTLKPHQKIFPIAINVLVGTLSLTAGILACLAFTAILPLIMFVGSILSIARNVGSYVEERFELKNLKNKFKDQSFLEKELSNLKLPPKLREDIAKVISCDQLEHDKVSDLLVRVANHFINTHTPEQTALSDLLLQSKKDGLSLSEKKSIKKQIHYEEDELKKAFKKDYGSLFKLLVQRQRLHYLKNNINQRLYAVGLSVVVATVSLVTMASAFSPLSSWVFGGVAVLGTVLGIGSAANSIRVMRKANQSKEEINQPIKEVTQSVFPTNTVSKSLKDKVVSLFSRKKTEEPKSTMDKKETFINNELYMNELVDNALVNEIHSNRLYQTKSKPIKRKSSIISQYNRLDDPTIVNKEVNESTSIQNYTKNSKPSK
jgi:hypothetical protein